MADRSAVRMRRQASSSGLSEALSRGRRKSRLTPLLCLLVVRAAIAGPTIEQGEARWILRNEHLALHFEVAKGGLLSRVEDRDGRPYLQGGTAYTDHGLYGETRVRVASDRAPGLLKSGGPGTVVASGTLAADGPLPDGPRLDYTQTVTLGEDPEFGFRTELRSSRAIDSASGFLAILWHLPAISEWWARTVDGRVNEVAGGPYRLYQSAAEPFDPEHPELGVVYPDGRRLILLDARAETGPLSNVFLHHAETYTALFLAWLDGGRAASWSPATPWVITGRLRIVPPGD